MDHLIAGAAKGSVNFLQQFFTGGFRVLQEAASDSKKATALFIIVLFAHFFAITAYFLVCLFSKSGRAKLRKYWRISKEGPFYRLGVWIFSLLVKLVLWLTGDRMYVVPTDCAPKFTTIKTQVSRIVLNWTAKPSSRWYTDMFELQILRKSGTAGGQDKSVKEEWETLYSGSNATFDIDDLDEDATFKFRVRTFNKVGASGWTEGSFATRQRPIGNGGKGPGYTWTQFTKELHVVLDVRNDAKSKDFVVECKSINLLVRDIGVSPPKDLICGEMWKSVKGSEMSWSLATNDSKQKQMMISFEKIEKTSKRKEHWTCLVKGHPLLDSRFLPDCIIPSGKMPDESEIA